MPDMLRVMSAPARHARSWAMTAHLPPDRAGRFRLFCRDWSPRSNGNLTRYWNGHSCRLAYAPGGHRVSVDGVELPDAFPDGNAALRAAFDAARRAAFDAAEQSPAPADHEPLSASTTG